MTEDQVKVMEELAREYAKTEWPGITGTKEREMSKAASFLDHQAGYKAALEHDPVVKAMDAKIKVMTDGFKAVMNHSSKQHKILEEMSEALESIYPPKEFKAYQASGETNEMCRQFNGYIKEHYFPDLMKPVAKALANYNKMKEET